jgi:hypothetical protein
MERERFAMTAAEMKFIRKAAKHTLIDHKRNRDTVKELKTQSVLLQINNCDNKWGQHVSR